MIFHIEKNYLYPYSKHWQLPHKHLLTFCKCAIYSSIGVLFAWEYIWSMAILIRIFLTCTWRNGYLWTYIMFFDPRNRFMGSKILKNYKIVACIGPEWAFLLLFSVFTHLLSLKNVKLNDRGDVINWNIDLHSRGSLENIRMGGMVVLALYRA